MNWLGEIVVKEIRDTDTVLDLGCGICQPTGRINCRAHLAVDAFRPYVDEIKREIPTLIGRLPECVAWFADSSWDVVLLLDVIEHLPRNVGFHIVNAAERIARRLVFVYTPNGHKDQKAYSAWGLGHNELQKHVSAFRPAEFKDRGYAVREWPKTFLAKKDLCV